jgi:integrase/recombinase XerD
VNTLHQAAANYLELRRGMGFKLQRDEARLRQFVSFMAERGTTRITTQLALQFATRDSHLSPCTKSMRLSMVRAFARYLAAHDPTTEVPPVGLLPDAARPAIPYLYSETEIVRLLQAAKNHPASMQFPDPLWRRYRGWLWYCFFGLLAVTGMRLSEVRNLRDEDINAKESVLTIRQAKFGKSRLVPLHRTMLQALATYIRHRNRFFARRYPDITPQRLFPTRHGTALGSLSVYVRFRRISHQIGLRGPNDRRGPRLHDFRHRFAIETLLRWYRAGEKVDRLLPVLSTYLGHTRVTGTYWYLRCTPELMAAAGDRLDRRWKGVQ